MLGTGHAVYSIMPIIGDIALKNGIRPERPMAAASVASQLAITGSPIAAVVATYLTGISGIPLFEHISLPHVVAVTIPLPSPAPSPSRSTACAAARIAGRPGISTPPARPHLARPHFEYHQHHPE